MNTLLNKANKKYHALARVCNYMNTNKRRVLMKAFITSQFSYCPLVWMFHSRTMNNRINTLHEKALRLVYTNKPKEDKRTERGQIGEDTPKEFANPCSRNL